VFLQVLELHHEDGAVQYQWVSCQRNFRRKGKRRPCRYSFPATPAETFTVKCNPNDPPEIGLDFAGYNFWLGKLNQFNGNFVNAEMVKAFITSGEYQARFGP